MFGKRTPAERQRFRLSARTAMCGLGVKTCDFRAYWNFLQQADKVRRQTLVGGGQTQHKGTKGARVGNRIPDETQRHKEHKGAEPKNRRDAKRWDSPRPVSQGPAPIFVRHEVKEQAWRALVERYVKQGLDRKTLVALLFRVLSVRLG